MDFRLLKRKNCWQFALERRSIAWLLGVLALVSVCLSVWLIAPVVAQSDSSLEQLRQRQQQIEQQKSQVSRERDRLQRQQQAAQKQLKGLQHTIKATAAQIQQSEKRLQQSTQRLRDLEVSLVKAEQAYRQRQYATVARLRFLQRQPVNRGWAVLLQSQNLTEFLDRRRQLRLVYAADRKMLSGLKDATDRLDRQRNQIERQKNEIALLTQQLYAQKSEFEAQASSQQSTIERLTSDQRALEAAEAQLDQDSRSLATLIQQKVAAQSGVAVRGTGQMVFPCNAPITSGFGMRMHPILGYERFHAGIDFGADYGEPIFAADRGTVIFAGWYGGYGNAVIIDHGGGVTTMYAHASELYVSEGQSVERGGTIAAVGSSGLSTGPHLHFEVRRNGEPVDPGEFL